MNNRISLLLILTLPLQGFVFLSGPREAKLDASISSPEVQFVIGSDAPSLTDRDDFKDGEFSDLDDEAFFQALVQEAMQVWNDVDSSYLRLSLVTGNDVTADSDDNIHSIVVDEANLSSAAFAAPSIEDDEITDCDITVADRSASSKSVAYTILHELGHCIGLGHNHSNYDAVMGYSRSSRQLRLGLDDKAGLTFLYPADGVDDPVETWGCAVIANGDKREALYLAILLFLPIFWIYAWPKLRWMARRQPSIKLSSLNRSAIVSRAASPNLSTSALLPSRKRKC